jgi:hypothetical protein
MGIGKNESDCRRACHIIPDGSVLNVVRPEERLLPQYRDKSFQRSADQPVVA